MGSLVCVIVDMVNGGSAPVTLPSLEAVSVLLINKLFCNNWTAFCSAAGQYIANVLWWVAAV